MWVHIVQNAAISKPRTTTGADGSFSIRVAIGRGGVSVRHPDYALFQRHGLTFDATRPIDLSVVLTRGGRVKGTVTLSSGVSPEGLGVSGGGQEATLPADGSFTLERIPAGRVTLEVLDPAPLVVTLSRSRRLEGRVVDARGAGIGGIEVGAVPEDPAGRYWHATTLPDGSFALTQVGTAPVNLLVGDPVAGFAFRPGMVAGGEAITLALRPAATLRISTRESDGRPVPTAGASGPIEVDGHRTLQLLGAHRRPDGTLEIAVPAGRVVVSVFEGRRRARVTADVTEGQTLDAEATLTEPD